MRYLKIAAVAVLSSLMLTPATAQQAPAAGSSPMTLTAEDYAQIYQLYARYAYGFDGGVDNGRLWASLYTADGMFTNFPNQKVKGSLALAEFARGALRFDNQYAVLSPEGSNKSTTSIGHVLTNIMLRPTAQGVVGKAHRLAGNAMAVNPSGMYISLIVKTDQGWRFAEMNFIGQGNPMSDRQKELMTLAGTPVAPTGTR